MELKLLGQHIIDHAAEFSKDITRQLEERYVTFLDQSKLEDHAITEWRAKLIRLVGEAIKAGSSEALEDKVAEWARMTGEGAVQYGISIDELIKTNKLYRKVILDNIEIYIETQEIPIKQFLKINRILDGVLDHSSYVFSVSFVEYHKQTLETAQQAMLDISIPVVSLTDKIAILPLIGELDTYRARILMENSLKRCIELRNTELIIDLSGVPIVDTMVANELFQVNKALSLIGVNPTFSGIRPDIAQAVVNLGIGFEEITIAGNLKQAFKKLLEIENE
ncbi:STAS domain-containing protein [Fictibacillus iocasae]|uniref:STAS domain-containing protein n=1 Tax=Fictibacillus iocasae TaxID=2715437 RepID=A0ABW2NPI7_9BACL